MLKCRANQKKLFPNACLLVSIGGATATDSRVVDVPKRQLKIVDIVLVVHVMSIFWLADMRRASPRRSYF